MLKNAEEEMRGEGGRLKACITPPLGAHPPAINVTFISQKIRSERHRTQKGFTFIYVEILHRLHGWIK